MEAKVKLSSQGYRDMERGTTSMMNGKRKLHDFPMSSLELAEFRWWTRRDNSRLDRPMDDHAGGARIHCRPVHEIVFLHSDNTRDELHR